MLSCPFKWWWWLQISAMCWIGATPGEFYHVLLDHFGFIHVLDHFALVGSDEVSLLGWLNPDAIHVLLMFSSIEFDQLAI
jgi:hypothetical protein